MREKRNIDQNGDYTCTGPDRYFDESLQYPRLNKALSSSSTFQIARKSVLIPSSSTMEENYFAFQDLARPSLYVTTTTTHYPKEPIDKSLRDSPTDSPGSKGTAKTGECTEFESDDCEDDLYSYCGSLTYSVESYYLDHIPTEEYDEGYHAEDEYTSHPGSSCSSIYDHDDDHEDLYNHDCFIGHPCSFLFGGIQDWIQTKFRQLGSSQQGMPRDDFERTLRERRRSYPSNHLL